MGDAHRIEVHVRRRVIRRAERAREMCARHAGHGGQVGHRDIALEVHADIVPDLCHARIGSECPGADYGRAGTLAMAREHCAKERTQQRFRPQRLGWRRQQVNGQLRKCCSHLVVGHTWPGEIPAIGALALGRDATCHKRIRHIPDRIAEPVGRAGAAIMVFIRIEQDEVAHLAVVLRALAAKPLHPGGGHADRETIVAVALERVMGEACLHQRDAAGQCRKGGVVH
jgi:hypothetical protein